MAIPTWSDTRSTASCGAMTLRACLGAMDSRRAVSMAGTASARAHELLGYQSRRVPRPVRRAVL
jgi:hypothetical protein